MFDIWAGYQHERCADYKYKHTELAWTPGVLIMLKVGIMSIIYIAMITSYTENNIIQIEYKYLLFPMHRSC